MAGYANLNHPEKQLFSDRERLAVLLGLYSEGYNYSSLSVLFGCDRKAVKYFCTKYAVAMGTPVVSVRREVSEELEGHPKAYRRFITEGTVTVNLGKTYAEYLAQKHSPSRAVLPPI